MAADEFLARATPHFLRLPVCVREPEVRIHGIERIADAFENGFEPFLCDLPVGRVLHDLRESQVASAVAKAVHQPVREDSRAVLPKVPAHVRRFSVGTGCLQLFVRLARGPILGSEDDTAGLADPLGCLVPEQLANPRAPTREPAVDVQQEHGGPAQLTREQSP